MSPIADNTTQSGTATIAADDVTTLNGAGSTGVLVQRVKVGYGDDGSSRDVSTAFPLPTTLISSGGLATIAGTITAAATNTPGSSVTASTTGQVVASTALAGNATFHVVTSAFVGTLVFEGSVDGGLNYGPIMALREDGTGAESSVVISTATYFIRQYTVALPGLAYFRVRASAFTSGTAAVIIAPGPFLIEPNPSLAASAATIGNVGINSALPTGANTIGAVGLNAGTNQIGTIGELRAAPLAVTVAGAAGAAATLTLPAAGAGLFHYISSLTIDLYSTAARTGVATPIAVTSTNLPGSLAWTFSTAGAIGAIDRYTVLLTTPLRSSAANTATTVVGPAVTGGLWRINATYFTAV